VQGLSGKETIQLSVLIPIFNEEEGLSLLLEQVVKACEQTGLSFEVIICNDGSSDSSEQIVLTKRMQDHRIKLISLSRNFGHHPAMQAGVDLCRGEAVILMDGDFQDPPEMIPALVQKWKAGYEIVCTRKLSRKDPLARRWFFKGFHTLFNSLASIRLEPGVGIFSLLDRKPLEALKRMPERNKYLVGMRALLGFRQVVLEFERPERLYGGAKQTLGKLFRLAFDAIFSFSSLPVQIIWSLGVIGICFSFVGILYVLYDKLIRGTALIGWSSTMISILFLGSVQLVGIGIIGEYLLRISEDVRRRPYYVIRRTEGFGTEETILI
jgi:dolichol-phosphate mannosyltransferase